MRLKIKWLFPVIVAMAPTILFGAVAQRQSVTSSGTKVNAAAKNTVVSDECQQKYQGCMDTFCVMDNVSGGRCMCSDKYAALEQRAAEIAKADRDSLRMATLGVEQVRSRQPLNVKEAEPATKTGRGVDLSLWNAAEDMDVDGDEASPTGAGLLSMAHEICVERVPECASKITLMSAMYSQSVRSDCTAWENALKKQQSESTQKADAAKKAVRTAALEQYRDANKYDLGQCIVEFKKCMVTTAECGEDFSGCTAAVAMNNVTVGAKAPEMYDIVGDSTTTQIAMSTYEVLDAKRVMCETVTKKCVDVADQVWGAFLREAAPQIKSAELIAENNLRQSCVTKISDCFQQACKDNIDPRDKDGSYDMCLTRPASMLGFCKPELVACGIETASEDAAMQSDIWNFVVARLASMRVDSCTAAVKECLQSTDRCGPDYTQCAGLDTDTIIRMCPYDKLVGCTQKYAGDEIKGDAVYDELADMVQGVMLSVDNSMLQYCENAVDSAMINACGDANDCGAAIVGDKIGAGSLQYGICEYMQNGDEFAINYGACVATAADIPDADLGRGSNYVKPLSGVLDGTIYWEYVTIDDDGMLMRADEYFAKSDGQLMTEGQRARVAEELSVLQSNIGAKIAAIESDMAVQFCTTGRTFQGLPEQFKNQQARFPNLSVDIRSRVTKSALNAAKENYYAKYDALNQQMVSDYAEIARRVSDNQGENNKDIRRDTARMSCINIPALGSMPKSPEPPTNPVGAIIIGAVVVATAVVVTVFTAGAGSIAVGAGVAAGAKIGVGAGVSASIASAAIAAPGSILAGTSIGAAALGSLATSAAVATGVGIAGGVLGAAGAVAMGVMSTIDANGVDSGVAAETTGEYSMEQWNFKQTIKTEFDMDTLNCHKCVTTKKCTKTKYPVFGKPKCTKWGEEVTECSDIQF